MFKLKFGQNPLICSEDRLQTINCSLYSKITLKIRSRSSISYEFVFAVPMLQHIKFGQNPSFGSRGRVQTICFWSKFDIQIAGVTLKMRSRSPKSDHFFPPS